MLATSRRGAARNNRIYHPNIVTRRAAAELTGTVTRYRGVCPNNNHNNNHAALAERFLPSTLHIMQQLGLCINTGTPDTARQLDAEAIAAEVAYTRTNTQPSCSGGENRIVCLLPSRRPWACPRRRVGRQHRIRKSRVWRSTPSSSW